MGSSGNVKRRWFGRGTCTLNMSPEAVKRRKRDEALVLAVAVCVLLLSMLIAVWV